MCNTLESFTQIGLAKLDSSSLREAISAAFESPVGKASVESARRVIDRLTSRIWPPTTLCRFISGWNSLHGTALFVSGLVVRCHQEARISSGIDAKSLIFEAAAELSELIAEDTGAIGTPHHELFALLADHLVGDDMWRLDRFQVSGCSKFRAWLGERRLRASIEEGILTTAASELWNAAEYSYLDSKARQWLSSLHNAEPKEIEQKLAYITVHAGETELGHFRHALTAWDFYCQAKGVRPSAEIAYRCVSGYLGQIGTAFEALEGVLSEHVE